MCNASGYAAPPDRACALLNRHCERASNGARPGGRTDLQVVWAPEVPPGLLLLHETPPLEFAPQQMPGP